jgi:DNA primase
MPEDAQPGEALAAAEAVCPDAANILASARFQGGWNGSDEARAAFLLDSVELASVRSRIREIRLSLAQAPPNASELMSEGARLRQRERELVAAVGQGGALLKS